MAHVNRRWCSKCQGMFFGGAIVACLTFSAGLAWAATGTSSGPFALAFATIVGEYSPSLGVVDKLTLAKLFAGNSHVKYPANKTITVSADKINCRTSDVDITLHSCDLTFGPKTITITGRRAHELYATLVENGVQGGAAAGSIYEALVQLSCTIDPNLIDQRSGGGATCNFTPTP